MTTKRPHQSLTIISAVALLLATAAQRYGVEVDQGEIQRIGLDLVTLVSGIGVLVGRWKAKGPLRMRGD